MVRRMLANGIVAAVLMMLLMACGESGPKDPYRTVTLRQATQNTPVSKQFRYKFKEPEIVATYRNLGLIREGGLIEFIGARSLEDKLKGKTDGYLELNVVKEFSPYVHFKVVEAATQTDTIFFAQAGNVTYPRIIDPADFNNEAYEEQDINKIPWNNTGTLNGLKDKKMIINGKIVVEDEEGAKSYFLVGENSKLRIADPGNGTGLIMKVLVENNYLFEGGVIMTAVEDFGPRRRNHVAGTVEVQYVKYGNKIVKG